MNNTIMTENRIVVKANCEGTATGLNCVTFKEGDTGTLTWLWHRDRTQTGFIQPMVTWDHDPEHVPRAILFNEVTPVGLEHQDCRVMILWDPKTRA